MKPYANGFIFCVDMEYISKMLSFLSKNQNVNMQIQYKYIALK